MLSVCRERGAMKETEAELRRRIMKSNVSKNTGPEVRVRKTLHAMGYRFRLHRRDLPGTPDIVLPKRRLALFVNGCFWHQHPGCRKASMPKTRTEFWKAKFERNRQRDELRRRQLQDLGWRVETIWECETKDPVVLERTIDERVGGYES